MCHLLMRVFAAPLVDTRPASEGRRREQLPPMTTRTRSSAEPGPACVHLATTASHGVSCRAWSSEDPAGGGGTGRPRMSAHAVAGSAAAVKRPPIMNMLRLMSARRPPATAMYSRDEYRQGDLDNAAAPGSGSVWNITKPCCSREGGGVISSNSGGASRASPFFSSIRLLARCAASAWGSRRFWLAAGLLASSGSTRL